MLTFNGCVLEPNMKIKLKDVFNYGEDSIVVDEMENYCGQIVTISSIDQDSKAFRIKEDNNYWYWDVNCIDTIIGENSPKFECKFNKL